jgi:hypothetical protein
MQKPASEFHAGTAPATRPPLPKCLTHAILTVLFKANVDMPQGTLPAGVTRCSKLGKKVWIVGGKHGYVFRPFVSMAKRRIGRVVGGVGRERAFVRTISFHSNTLSRSSCPNFNVGFFVISVEDKA